MREECLDCGAKISPGWDYCLTCGSKFEDQMEKSKEEQALINNRITKSQKAIKQEFKRRLAEKTRERRKKELKKLGKQFLVFFIISVVTGIIGYFIGLIYFDEGGWGFVIGFFGPLLLIIIVIYVLDELFDIL
ncbi:MAG: hypothetical protein ACFFFB_24890 [Candidatus Heimdallarchaeota archaeon]